MNTHDVTCSSIVNIITRKDSLFHGRYTIDPYQKCSFGCVYCDSATKDTVVVKTNAVEKLKEELPGLRKGVIIVGSVHDPYQPVEETYKITRKLLEVIQENSFPCHILTKSLLVQRDIDLLSSMDARVTVSFVAYAKKTAQIFEPSVASVRDRLQMITTLTKKKIKTGVAIIPILPYIVDAELLSLIQAASKAHARYLLHRHLELKGDQKQQFMAILKHYFPHLVEPYTILFSDTILPKKQYQLLCDTTIKKLCRSYAIAEKIR